MALDHGTQFPEDRGHAVLLTALYGPQLSARYKEQPMHICLLTKYTAAEGLRV